MSEEHCDSSSRSRVHRETEARILAVMNLSEFEHVILIRAYLDDEELCDERDGQRQPAHADSAERGSPTIEYIP